MTDGRRSDPAAAPAPLTGQARYRRIVRFAAQQIVLSWWFDMVLPRVGLRAVAERGRSSRLQRTARTFSQMAMQLGGLMIKVGQMMSARLDVLPPEMTAELQHLQDEVPAVPFEQIRTVAERELGMPVEGAYEWIDRIPLAAASLGQAHRARLRPEDAAAAGFTDVVVKIQRPGIEDIVDTDLAALRRVAGWLSRVRAVSSRANVPALVEEFARTTREEVDYLHEAQAAETFAERFADDDRLTLTSVVWERTGRRVLTLSDVTAIKISDVDAIRAAGIDPTAVANEFARIMLEQIFLDGRFHADPHPGNVFVRPARGERPFTLTFIDFGMMGEISDATRGQLQDLLVAVTARDGRRMVSIMSEMGALLPSADAVRLEEVIAAVFARFGGMGFAELRDVDPRQFTDFAREFGDVMREMPFQLPENILFLIRAVSLMSGVCSGLDPRFNVWDAVEPFAGEIVRTSGPQLVQRFAKEAVDTLGIAVRLPRRIDDLVTTAQRGQLTVATPKIDARLSRLERLAARILGAVVFAGFIVSGALVLPAVAPLGITLMCVSVLPLAFAVFPGRRS